MKKSKSSKKVIIMGMGPAAVGAAAAIQHSKKKADLILIEKKDYEMYSPCGMPFAFEGKLKFSELKHDFPSKGLNSKVYLKTEVKKIDVNKKELLIETEDQQEVLKYDSLIIATGTKPLIPPIKNIEKFLKSYRAYPLNSLESVSYLYFLTRPSNKITIIGAGAIGLEFAAAANKIGLEVLVAEMMPQVFPNVIDQDMANHVQEYLENKGIKILTDSKVESLNGNNRLESITIAEEDYETDVIALACGTMPNIDCIKDSGIDYNKNGIITNNRMMTNVKGVYAAGDCVETLNFLTNKKCRSALAIPARKQGRIAGMNVSGKRAAYKGTLNTFISVLDDYAIGSTGLTSEQAKAEGYELVMQKIKGLDKPEYYPGNQDLIVKLVANKKGKILGGQVFGEKNAVKNRIDVIASYLSRKSSIKDMMDGELAYCPDVAPIPDPLTTALDFMLRRLK